MNERPTHFEDLPAELFGVIFEYLAPHDLLHAFKKLNRRFKSILTQQPLSLPSNRSMSYRLYCDYLTKIIPKHVSQIVYLHLSERHSPHAVTQFISEVPINSRFWPALKAVTIEDVPRDVFEELLSHSSFLLKVQSLTLDISFHRYHSDEYDECGDFEIVIPILSLLSELRSVYIHIINRSVIRNYAAFNERFPQMDIHRNLQILSINQCSRELLVELLNNGYLPNVRRLNVSISCNKHEDMAIDPPNPTPLKQAFTPELRHININLFAGVNWVLIFFEDLQRHSQLDYFNLSGHVRFTNNSNFPRVATLQQWLTLTKSNLFQFRMKLSADYVLGADSVREEVFADYRRATGDEYSARYREIDIRYPEMSFSYPTRMDESNLTSSDDSTSDESVGMDEDKSVEMDEDEINSTTSSEWLRGEPLDENVEEMEFEEHDYVNNGLFKELQAIPCWYRLKRIEIIDDVFRDEKYVVGRKLTRLADVIQCSPQLRELHIKHNLDYGRALSSNVELGILLASKLDVFCYTASQANSSLGDLARIVDTLFSHATSPLRLKELTLNIDGHPSAWLSTEHLVRWIAKLFKRFPLLIHFTVGCDPADAYEDSEYSLSKLAPEWYVMSLLGQRIRRDPIEYRHKPHSLDIWL